MDSKQRAIFELVVGTSSLIAFGYFTNVWAAIALFLFITANNVGVKK